jgi:hypothetical protein
MHSSIGNQSQFKFLMAGGDLGTQGTLNGGNMMSKTLGDDGTLGA